MNKINTIIMWTDHNCCTPNNCLTSSSSLCLELFSFWLTLVFACFPDRPAGLPVPYHGQAQYSSQVHLGPDPNTSGLTPGSGTYSFMHKLNIYFQGGGISDFLISIIWSLWQKFVKS